MKLKPKFIFFILLISIIFFISSKNNNVESPIVDLVGEYTAKEIYEKEITLEEFLGYK